MKSKNKKTKTHQYPLPGEISKEQKKKNADALRQAEKNMRQDEDLAIRDKNEDLDEGDLARLGEKNNDLV